MADDAKTAALKRCVEALVRAKADYVDLYEGDPQTGVCERIQAAIEIGRQFIGPKPPPEDFFIGPASAAPPRDFFIGSAATSRTYADGVRDERARVVARLRRIAEGYELQGMKRHAIVVRSVADTTERGEHEVEP